MYKALPRLLVTEMLLDTFASAFQGFGEPHRRSASLFAAKFLNQFIDEFLGSAAGDVLLVDGVCYMLKWFFEGTLK